jgi:hypothetical protein
MLHLIHVDDTSVPEQKCKPTGVGHARAELFGQGEIEPCEYIQVPLDVVETDDIDLAAKLAILKAWEADERALLRAEDEGMGGGEHAHLHKVQAALAQLGKDLCSTATERTLRAS